MTNNVNPENAFTAAFVFVLLYLAIFVIACIEVATAFGVTFGWVTPNRVLLITSVLLLASGIGIRQATMSERHTDPFLAWTMVLFIILAVFGLAAESSYSTLQPFALVADAFVAVVLFTGMTWHWLSVLRSICRRFNAPV